MPVSQKHYVDLAGRIRDLAEINIPQAASLQDNEAARHAAAQAYLEGLRDAADAFARMIACQQPGCAFKRSKFMTACGFEE